jgi:hypothetical protein
MNAEPNKGDAWDQMNCAEKRALLNWANDRKQNGLPYDVDAIRNAGMFEHASNPDCTLKPACKNCTSALNALNIWVVSEYDPPNTPVNSGLSPPSGLCP